MCGRFVAASDPDGLVRFFTVDERKDDELTPSWNVAPTDRVRAVVEHADRRVLVTLRWGLVPSWAGDRAIGSRLINARVESVGDKPAFRSAYARRRCIVPADAFYEWRTGPDGGKQPYLLRDAAGNPLAFAGLWELWRPHDAPADDASRLVRSCTILTMPADEVVGPLHDRMPVVLPPDAWDRWLDRRLQDTQVLGAILRTAGAALVIHPVSAEVNTPHNNHPGLIERASA